MSILGVVAALISLIFFEILLDQKKRIVLSKVRNKLIDGHSYEESVWFIASLIITKIILPTLLLSALLQYQPINMLKDSYMSNSLFLYNSRVYYSGLIAFLSMYLCCNSLHYFVYENNYTKWIPSLEIKLQRLANIESTNILIPIFVLLLISINMPSFYAFNVMLCGTLGVILAVLSRVALKFLYSLFGKLDHLKNIIGFKTVYILTLDLLLSIPVLMVALSITTNILVVVPALILGAILSLFVSKYITPKNKNGSFKYPQFLDHGIHYAMIILCFKLLLFFNQSLSENTLFVIFYLLILFSIITLILTFKLKNPR